MTIKQTETVTLAYPIDVEEGESMTTVELREPYAGEMRGLKFANIMEADVDTMTILIPRISKLTDRQMLSMRPANLVVLISGVMGFFVEDDLSGALTA